MFEMDEWRKDVADLVARSRLPEPVGDEIASAFASDPSASRTGPIPSAHLRQTYQRRRGNLVAQGVPVDGLDRLLDALRSESDEAPAVEVFAARGGDSTHVVFIRDESSLLGWVVLPGVWDGWPTKIRYTCPVCAYPDLYETAYGGEGFVSFEICPSCGFEFGVSDLDAGYDHATWRARWIAEGKPWSSRHRHPPEEWDPGEQLKEP